MSNNLLENKSIYQLYKRLFFLTVFFVIAEIGANMNIVSFITPYKIFLGLLVLLYFIHLITDFKNVFNYTATSVVNSLKPIKFIAIFIILYIAFDLISLFYTTNIRLGVTKYVTIISMSVIIFFTTLYVSDTKSDDKKDKANSLLVIFGFSSLALSLYTIGYLLIFKTTYFSRRLSLLEDYNKYSFVLLFGFLSMLYYLFRSLDDSKKRNIYMALMSIISIPVIHLSGSRRSSKMMNVLVLIIFIFGFYSLIEKYSDKDIRKKLKYYLPIDFILIILITIAKKFKPTVNPWFIYLVVFIIFLIKTIMILKKFDFKDLKKRCKNYIITWAIIAISSVFIISSFNFITTIKAGLLVKNNKEVSQHIDSRSVEAILDDEKALDKRTVIWKIALDEFKKQPMKNKLIGSGASYHFDIYNKPENKAIMEKVYWKVIPDNLLDPHNFILVDLLNGGLIKTAFALLALLSALVYIIKLNKKSTLDAFFLFIICVTLFGDLMIGAKEGMLDNKFLWAIFMLLIAVFNEFKDKKEIESK
ncbi:MAG: hypothetical protein GX982_01150 [Tissierellia bacterium]|nr:hypothetical protein [Tissierellia bacterium]